MDFLLFEVDFLLFEVDFLLFDRPPQTLDEDVVQGAASPIQTDLDAAILIWMPQSNKRSVNARLVNGLSWSVLNTSGRPCLNDGFRRSQERLIHCLPAVLPFQRGRDRPGQDVATERRKPSLLNPSLTAILNPSLTAIR